MNSLYLHTVLSFIEPLSTGGSQLFLASLWRLKRNCWPLTSDADIYCLLCVNSLTTRWFHFNFYNICITGFWANHNTETALIMVVNDFRSNMDMNKQNDCGVLHFLFWFSDWVEGISLLCDVSGVKVQQGSIFLLSWSFLFLVNSSTHSSIAQQDVESLGLRTCVDLLCESDLCLCTMWCCCHRLQQPIRQSENVPSLDLLACECSNTDSKCSLHLNSL